MECDEILTVLKVLLFLESTSVDPISNINFCKILDSLKRRYVVTDEKYDYFIRKYSPGASGENAWQILGDICFITSFKDFLCALNDSGYFELCKALQVQRRTLIEQPAKLALSMDETLVTYYTRLRKLVDDNSYKACNKSLLKKFIFIMDNKINERAGHSGLLLLHKKVIAYSILAQQYSNIKERNAVMQRMRDDMPQDADRTIFDVTYHSLMSVNWAIQGNVISSEKHEEKVMQILIMNDSRLLNIIASFGSLYKNDVLFFHSRSPESVTKAQKKFYTGMRSTVGMSFEEGVIHRNVAMVEHVRYLLGINLDCSVCDIKEIETGCIQRARDILGTIEEGQLPKRRRMKFLLNKGRLYELCNVRKAAQYVKQAIEFTDDETEGKNIREYMEYLQMQRRPQFSVKM